MNKIGNKIVAFLDPTTIEPKALEQLHNIAAMPFVWPHVAGRNFSRTEARRRFTMADLEKAMIGKDGIGPQNISKQQIKLVLQALPRLKGWYVK